MNDSEIQKLFRNYQQMDAIYQDLHAAGRSDEPYLIKFEYGKKLLIFIGCRHSNNANDKQILFIEEQWQAFIKGQNKKKTAFCEGGLRPYESNKELAIEKYSEPGLLRWLAYRDNIQLVSPEPEDSAEVGYLLNQ